MTVKVTLEFENVDLAIVALAKLTKAAGTTIVDGKPRKGRADKGQARGPHKPATQEAAAGASDAASAASQEPAKHAGGGADSAPVAASAPAAASPTLIAQEPDRGPLIELPIAPSEAEAQKAIERLFESTPDSAVGIQKSKDALAQFGVRRVRDLKPEQRAEFIKNVEATLAAK